MRYYKIELKSPLSPQWIVLDELSPSNLGAIHFTLDTTMTTQNQASNSQVVLFNPAQELLSKSLIGWSIRITAGFKSALPLANSNQIGVVLLGVITQQLPNITTLTPTLAFFVQAFQTNKKVVLTYQASEWITWGRVLRDAMSKFGITQIAITPELEATKMPYSIQLNCATIAVFWDYLVKQNINCYTAKSIPFFYQGERPKTPNMYKKIGWDSLIGMPVGQSASGGSNQFGIAEVSIPCNLRGDIEVGDGVILTTSAGDTSALQRSSSVLNNTLSFAGAYQVNSIHHVIQSRDPSSESYCTTYSCTKIGG